MRTFTLSALAGSEGGRVTEETVERMEEEIGYLKNSEIFGRLSAQTLKIIADSGKMETYTSGDIIFRIGDPSDAIHVVKSGVVEICRAKGDREGLSVVAYLGESDPIGEMAIMTGSARASLARVPQRAEILRIEKEAFMGLLNRVPELSVSLLGVLSKRLEDGIRRQRAAARYQHLSGNLKYFDLPTIIQTLATTERTGTLTITGQGERIFATIYLETGKVLHAHAGHLRGEEAFYQVFQSPVQDAFTFKGGSPPAEFEVEAPVGTTTMALLMEAARQQDELKVMKARHADPNRAFRPQSETLSWDDDETKDLAGEIWARVQGEQTIAQMVRELPVCEYRIYKVLSTLNAKGLAA